MKNEKRKPLSARNVLESQERWLKSNLLATLVTAAATVLYLLTTIFILLQMKKDTRLQRDYYQKTVRPFVYVTKIIFPYTIQKKDTTFDISYKLKNIGALPAKGVRPFLRISQNFFSDTERSSRDLTSYESSLFPNEELETKSDYLDKPLEYFEKNRFIYFHIEYDDAGGKKYFYKSCSEIKELYPAKPSKPMAISIRWVDFN